MHGQTGSGAAQSVADVPLIDSHAHLTRETYRDADAAIQRAWDAGLIRLLVVATDLPSSRSALLMATDHGGVFAAVGIHPNSVRDDDDYGVLRELATHYRVRAIGETGLDYYRDHTAPSLQRAALERHLQLAAELHLPVSIHNRSADGDIIAALTGYAGSVRGVMHCFSGDLGLAERALLLGYYISFAGNLTYPSAGPLREVAAMLPEDRLLVETDAPYLSPVPLRGKHNEPAHVGITLRALAVCRGVAPEVLAPRIVANAEQLFGW